jgi:serine protease Do
MMQDLTPELGKKLGTNAPPKGAIVSQVQPGSPADKAGVKPGDVIVDVDSKPVDGSKAVQRTVLGKSIGQKVGVALWRDGKTMTVNANLAELPGEEKLVAHAGERASPKTKLGIGLQPITPELAKQLGVERTTKGAVVTSVREGSPAQEAGVQEGDIIIEVDRKPVASPDDAAHLLTSDQAGGHLLRIKRHDGALFVVVPPAQ